MTNTSEDKFTEKFNEARVKYVKGLPTRITEIKAIWQHLNNVEWRLGVLLKMQNLCHNLAGSGGTFGFPNLSEQAKKIELALNELKATDDLLPEKTARQVIDDLLIGLQEVELASIRSTDMVPSLLNKTDTIFIIDSDAELSLNMSRQLMYYGCTVKIINDLTALEKNLRGAVPLIILIDLEFAQTPFNGNTVMQVLQQDWGIICSIVFISTKDDFENRMLAIKNNASAYFTKPIDTSLLVERINILSNSRIVEPYRVLIIEDDVELANYYALILERGGIRAEVEPNPEMVLTAILGFNPELVVMDLHMPNYNGIDIVKMLRQHQSLFSLPIVLLTSEHDIYLQFLAREVGVDDFLMKPIQPEHLYEAVLNRVQRARYMNLSMCKDSLTGLFVHKKINEYLKMQLSLCARYNHQLSYAIMDIDDFKKINDTYGHLAGDNVLIVLANILKSGVRAADFVGRYGGDEFVIVFPETKESDAIACIERLRNKFAQAQHYIDNHTFSVTFSAGIASFPIYTDSDAIMAMADKALYESKINGKNRTSKAE